MRPEVGEIMERSMNVAREGLLFSLPLAITTVILAIAEMYWVTAFFFVVTSFVIWFFRDPKRNIPEEERAVVSPADGRVIKIEEVMEDTILEGKFKKISIFMNIFNVHVNRIPCSGKVDVIQYRKGKFFSANLDKA